MISSFETDRLPQGYYTQTGTVLQRRDSSKEGQSLLLFMRDLGPRWVNAPAASSKNRFGGATEPLVWGEYNLYQSPNTLYLKGAEIKEDFLILRTRRKQLMTAMRFYKRLSKILMVGHESNKILVLLWGSLLLLKENCPEEIVEFRFTWRLLNAIGIAPSLVQCVDCGSEISGTAYWCQDGLMCNKCRQCGQDIDAEGLRLLQAAALLEHEKFIKWSAAKDSCEFFCESNKKLMTFFSDFN